MNTTARGALLAFGLVAGGLVAGPVITAQGEPTPDVASESLAEAGAPSLFVPIAAYRAFDSREDGNGKLTAGGDPFGPFSSLRRFFADLAIDGDGEIQIPAEAIAVSYNVTVTQTEGTGFLVVSAANTNTGLTTSNINWTGNGLNLANSGNVPLGPNNDGGNGSDSIDITIGGPAGSRTHAIIDITGYYIPAE